MGMPASLAGDMSLGHAFSPSPITPTTTNVMVEKKIPHVAGDAIVQFFLEGKLLQDLWILQIVELKFWVLQQQFW